MRKMLVGMMLWASVFSISFAQDNLITSATTLGAAQPELIKVIETETSILGQFHLAPIVVPEGERVGDIIDTTNATLIAGPDDCFPGLKPRETPSQLPAIKNLSEKELAAALGVAAGPEASGEVRSGRTFSLDFQDVRVERVSIFQLRNALRKNAPECDSVRPYINTAAASSLRVIEADTFLAEARKVAISDRPPPLIIGTIVHARRVVHVRTDETLAADAKISFGAQLLKRLGLGSAFEAAGGGGGNSANTLDIIGTISVPVAFAPAFVITSTKKLANGKAVYEIANLRDDSVDEKQGASKPKPREAKGAEALKTLRKARHRAEREESSPVPPPHRARVSRAAPRKTTLRSYVLSNAIHAVGF